MVRPGFPSALASFLLGQPADNPLGPLILTLVWGCGPTVLVFLVVGGRLGLRWAKARWWWLLMPPPAVVLLWLVASWLAEALEPGEIDRLVVWYGGLLISWSVLIAACVVPLRHRGAGCGVPRHESR